jgi:hypothetical protein
MCLAILAVGTGCVRREESRVPAPVPVVVEDWSIEPGARLGSVPWEGSEQELIGAFGAASVRDKLITMGEGATAPGAIVYPDDPQRRIEIVWGDPGAKRNLSRVILRGDRSRWTLPPGISLGTSLRELEEKNGRPFRLTGFGWDYAGAVISWQGGALDSTLTPGVHIYLMPRPEHRAGPEYSRLQGDREFPSSHPAMQELNPRVYQIFVDGSML